MLLNLDKVQQFNFYYTVNSRYFEYVQSRTKAPVLSGFAVSCLKNSPVISNSAISNIPHHF